MAAIQTRTFASELLANAIAAAPVPLGPLNGAEVILYANNIALTEKTLLADLVQPTAGGYVKSAAVVWAGPAVDANDDLFVYGDQKAFVFTDNVPLDTIYGYGVVDGTGTKLLLCETFPSPVTPLPNEVITVAPRFGLPDAVSATEAV